MSILSGISDFFGLDIGASAVRMVQLKGQGATKSLARYGSTPVEGNISLSDSPEDIKKMSELIKQAVKQHGMSTNNVAVGIQSNKVFSTIVDMDKLSPHELEKTLEYQVDSIIPTKASESKVDWAVLGDSPVQEGKVEVLVSSVANSLVESKLDMLESIGLNVVAFETDSIALARAIVPNDSPEAMMVVDLGLHSADIIIVMAGSPRLSRTISTGTDAIIKAAATTLAVDYAQAEQFVFKFGLVKDKLEGQLVNAITPTIDLLVQDIDKSIKFFNGRYKGVKIDRIIVTGGASILPEFPLHLANNFGVNVEIGNAWRNVNYDSSRQNELQAISNHFGVAAGLAERKE
ncbi:MAG: type IV pilus assembly protein PilM [Patescibacteria group bacterium]